MSTLGPNKKRLIMEKVSRDAIPPGSKHPTSDVSKLLLDPKKLSAAFKSAMEWVDQAIAAVQQAGPEKDEEIIAGRILSEIQKKRRGK